MRHKSRKLPFKNRLKGKGKLLATQLEDPCSKLDNYTSFLDNCSQFLWSLSLPIKNKPTEKHFYLHHWQENHTGIKTKPSCFPAFLAGKLQDFCCCSEVSQATKWRALGGVHRFPASVFQNTKEQGNHQGSNKAGTVARGSSPPSRSKEHRARVGTARDT